MKRFSIKQSVVMVGAVAALALGTGIVPATDKNTGAKSLSLMFRALLGFHKLYSRTLLRAACSRLSHR